MIPSTHTAAVERALTVAFGTTSHDGLEPVTGSHLNPLVFRITVAGIPYLLKIIQRQEDPTRHFTSMRAAAAAGLAPRVWHTSVDDRLVITDFISTQAFSAVAARQHLPLVLRRLHALEPFDRAPFNTTCTFLLTPSPYAEKFRASNLLDTGEFFARLDEIAAAWPGTTEEDLVASHNDLFKPDNMLFDGERAWLVDWEAAFRNDRYADLAAVTLQVVTNAEEEAAFLEAYFGQPATPAQRARLHLMQQLAHLFYTMAFLSLANRPLPSNALPFDEFQRLFWTGQIDVGTPEGKLAAAGAHWRRLQSSVAQQ